MNSCRDIKPSLRTVDESIIPSMTYMSFFLLFFPRFLIEFVIDATNRNLRAQGHAEVTFGEFLMFLGLQLYMCCIEGLTNSRKSEPSSKCGMTI